MVPWWLEEVATLKTVVNVKEGTGVKEKDVVRSKWEDKDLVVLGG